MRSFRFSRKMSMSFPGGFEIPNDRFMSSPNRDCVWITAAVFVVSLGAWTSARSDLHRRIQPQAPTAPTCRISGRRVSVPDLREGSGVAASRTRRGVLWAHNDSAQPVLVVLDEQGTIAGRVRVAGAEVDDWEDIAVGPCPQGSCVYIGDIGDNGGRRPHVTVYRAPEPREGETATAPAEVFRAKYPDGAHDAESLFVTDGADIFIITKGDPGPIALYRFPRPLRAGTVVQLERVGEPLAQKPDSTDRPTSADVSHDGQWVAVRTTAYVAFYAAGDLTAGRWKEAFRTDVSSLGEPRGEGVTFGRDGSVFLVGEGGALRNSGTFARLACSFDR